MPTSKDSPVDPESTIAAQQQGNNSEKHTAERPFALRLIDSLGAFVAAITFIVGFVLYTTTSLKDVANSENSTLEKLTVIQDNEVLYYFSNVVLYIIFGLAQLVVTYAMGRRYRVMFPETSALSQGLGLVWVTLVVAAGMIGNVGTKAALDLLNGDGDESDAAERATALWDASNTIRESIGGGNEIVGGCWVLLVSVCEFVLSSRDQTATPMAKRCSKARAIVGMAAGVAGIVNTIPVLEDAGAVFGLIMIAWYIVVGIVMLRN